MSISPAAHPLVVALLALGGAPAQDSPRPAEPQSPSAQESIDLPALIAKVRAAHWPTPRKAPLDRFKALLRNTPARSDQASAEIDLTVSFLAPSLLRYRVDEPGKTLEQGVDEKGVWSLIGKEVQRIQGKEQRSEAETARGYVSLAAELLKLLDPAAVLESLQEPSAPRPSSFAPNGKDRVPTYVVSGRLDDFPLQAPTPDGKRSATVALTITVDARTGLLVLAEARPLNDKHEPTGALERVLLRDPIEQGGMVLPRELLLYRGNQLDSRVAIRSIDLSPEGLTADSIRRPR
ncbi:MAG: hypothetical protein U1F36_09040 [Planctomycetota bacterium]